MGAMEMNWDYQFKEESLGSGQIRESNRAMLHAAAIQQQCKVIDLGIVRDDKDLDRIMDKGLFAGIINESAFEFVKHLCERMVSLDSFNQVFDLDKIVLNGLAIKEVEKESANVMYHNLKLENFLLIGKDKGAMLKAINVGLSVLSDEGREKLVDDEKIKCKMKPMFSGHSIGYLSRIKRKMK
ncbi:hypothetical protein GH714_043511 [Hevea brasiliensis]|uniref:Uncharacterized protein n=1 Tax=Hevea brasiliensis TaxID=3981 RepID=A0A6A6K2Z1_HEVBR|nr:hypothetical protein GH714_043511 [Hevea brasiliensis]